MLNDLPYLSAGEGPPLIVLIHTPRAADPTGLAADHPGLIDRLVLAGTACTLGPAVRRSTASPTPSSSSTPAGPTAAPSPTDVSPPTPSPS